MPPPGDESRARLDARGATHAALTRPDLRFSQARLAVFGVLVLVALMAWFGLVSAWWLLAPLLALAVLVQRHDRVVRARDAAARASRLLRTRASRGSRTDGSATGTPGDRFVDDRHLYANDLDLFGRGSLFELLSIARTQAGEDDARGLAEDAGRARPRSRERQQAIAELTTSLDFREAIAVVGTDAAAFAATGSWRGPRHRRCSRRLGAIPRMGASRQSSS